MSLDVGTAAVRHARAVAEAAIEGRPIPAHPRLEPMRALRGAFVTLCAQGALRGCVGAPLPDQPLHEAIEHGAQGAIRAGRSP